MSTIMYGPPMQPNPYNPPEDWLRLLGIPRPVTIADLEALTKRIEALERALTKKPKRRPLPKGKR